MTKSKKIQTARLLRLLETAHKRIEQEIEKNQIEKISALLTQCQESVICLGQLLGENGEEAAEVISVLEEYCELVYQIYEAVNSEINLETSEVKEEFSNLLKHMEDGIKHIPVRKEVVFLPYKASMWDSLESVWKAADEDPDCDAYVVPIPYFDKNPDGSFKELHYEGGEYPDNVPVIHYNNYSLKERQPDIVFVHNPYDDCNYVTSIHPAFYSQELKKYTDKLVYIPYFVLGEINPENDAEVEGMAHFCTLPGVMNADKVIVQSEAMRQAYIKVLTGFVKRSNRAYWEKRILGLGSPKLDKVNSVTEADVEIPEEWKPILYKPDGSRRKVIFYNTSVSSLLEHDHKMLTKMRDVFRTFYESREEVALLWRPHPLIKATIESMRPHLWYEYEKLVKEYREAGWGIYDDSADMNRAIALSDAYYGDPSSVVQLCQERGMFVIIQDVDETTKL